MTVSISADLARTAADSEARRRRRTDPSTEMTAGAAMSSTSRRPPSSRRSAAQRAPEGVGSGRALVGVEFDEAEGLGDAEFVGEERGHRSRAAVARVVAAQHEGGVADHRPRGRSPRRELSMSTSESMRTARAAPAANASRSTASAPGGPTQTTVTGPWTGSSSRASSSAASSAGDTPAQRASSAPSLDETHFQQTASVMTRAVTIVAVTIGQRPHRARPRGTSR